MTATSIPVAEGDSVIVSKSTGGGGGGTVVLPWVVQSKGISGKFRLGAATTYGLGKYYDPAVLSGVMTRLNATLMRDVMEWKKLETVVGVYNWTSSYGLRLKQWLAKLADQPGREAIVTVCNAGTLYSDFQWGGPPTGASGVLHWQNYVKSVVQNCSPLGCHNYEMWNEVNVPSTGGWGGTRQQFIDLIKPTYDVMKSVDPAAFLSLGAIINATNSVFDNGRGTPYQWLTDLAKANYSAMPDVRIAYHNYYDGSKTIAQRTPEQFYAEDMATYNAIAPFRNWETSLTEVGWYTKDFKFVSEDVRAQYYTRYPFLVRSVPGLRQVTIWEMAAMTSPEYALYDSTLTASPGAIAFGNAAGHVNVATEAVHSLLSTSHCVALKCPDNRYALWDETSTRNVTLTVNSPGVGVLTIHNMATGAKTTKTLATGSNSVPITIGPGAQVLSATVSATLEALDDEN